MTVIWLSCLLILTCFDVVLGVRRTELFGNFTLAYYYTDIYIGTPPQKKSLIIDTGSQLTTFACKGCYECQDHLNGLFEPDRSSTYSEINDLDKHFGWTCNSLTSKNRCEFLQSYAEGSQYVGYYAKDVVRFKNELGDVNKDDEYKGIFGCAMEESGLFYHQEVDGIMGLGNTTLRTSYLISSQPSTISYGYRERNRKGC